MLIATVVFGYGVDRGYAECKLRRLPMISVAPNPNPLLDESRTQYTFPEERDIIKAQMRTILRIATKHSHRDICMALFPEERDIIKAQMRTILRIATKHSHRDICMAPFGVGYRFNNSAVQVAMIWRELFFGEEEFKYAFSNIVFVVDERQNEIGTGGKTVYETFRAEFDPHRTAETSYR